MIKIIDNKNLDDFISEYGFKKRRIRKTNYYVLTGTKMPLENGKCQQEFMTIHENLRVIECYGLELLSVIYDMTQKKYLEDV